MTMIYGYAMRPITSLKLHNLLADGHFRLIYEKISLLRFGEPLNGSGNR